jgi:hypothetical protein
MKNLKEMSIKAFRSAIKEPTISVSGLKLLCVNARTDALKRAQISGGAYYAGQEIALEAVIQAIDGNTEMLENLPE